MNCIIIEDQPPAQRILKKYIADIDSLTLLATFSDAIQAMDFLKNNVVDLIFLDIHLPKLSGIDFLETLNPPCHVILTTAFPDYALKSYEFNVVDYLLKPFSFQRFMKAVAKIPARPHPEPPNSQPTSSNANSIFIKSGYDHIRIDIQDMLFIKSDGDYTEIHLPKKKHLSPEPLKYWLEKLEPYRFTQVHKSYIINTEKIEKISGSQVYLNSAEHSVPIGRAYKDSFIKKFVQ